MDENFPVGIGTERQQSSLNTQQFARAVPLRQDNRELFSHQFLCASCQQPLVYLSTDEQEGLLIMKRYTCYCGKVYFVHFARVGIYEQGRDILLLKQCMTCFLLYSEGDTHFCS